MPKKKTIEAPGKTGEIVGVLIMLCSALLLFSLVYRFVDDPSFNTVAMPAADAKNPIGPFGSHAADLLLQFGGFASLLLPLAIAVAGMLVYRRRPITLALSQIAGYGILIITIATLLALFWGREGGGVVGLVLADLLRAGLGSLGSVLVALTMLIVALILAVNFSPAKAFGWAGDFSGGSAEWLRERWALYKKARQRREAFGKQEAAAAKKQAPIIRARVPETVEPAARESKRPGAAKPDRPVRSTRLDQPEPAAAVPETAMSHEQITIHKQAETVAAHQFSFSQLAGNYEPPPLELLAEPTGGNTEHDREALYAQAAALESKLATFGVSGKVVEIHPGPVITMFEYEPEAGIKVSKIANLEDDLAMALQAEKIRIIAPIPGKGAVGIEVPSLRRQTVYLREILESAEFNDAESPLTVSFGKDSRGVPMVQNLARMPHLLVAGTTGSGKSVFLNCVILSLMTKSTPDQVRLLMVDPKQLELSMYTDTPHMLHPVIIEPKKAALLLRWAVGEMEERYGKLSELRVRNIESYNAKVAKLQAKKPRKGKLTGDDEDVPEKLPYIVVIIDELADLMMIAAKEVEESIARLAQMARAAGIHLILATQRPSVDVITGLIKANFPSRISFQVRSKVDSRTILDENGANSLLGMGDALFLPPGASKIERFHSALVSDDEVHAIVRFLKEKHPPPASIEIRTPSGADLNDADANDLLFNADDEVDNQLFDQAIEIVARDRKASVSYIQRKLKIGYNRAARIIERMEQEGMIAPSDGTSRPRQIFMPERDYD